MLFILGLKLMAHPRTAARETRLAPAACCWPCSSPFENLDSVSGANLALIVVGLIVGGAIGAVLAVRVQMTQMPQLVALFNGFGGAASVLVAGGELLRVNELTDGQTS